MSAITISGHWQGEAGTTRHYFSGRVTSSEHPQVSEGVPVMVTYECPEQRVVASHVHGHYLLKWRGLVFPLVSFLCDAIRHPGQADCQRNARPTQWSALVILEALSVEEVRRAVRHKRLRQSGT